MNFIVLDMFYGLGYIFIFVFKMRYFSITRCSNQVICDVFCYFNGSSVLLYCSRFNPSIYSWYFI